MAYTLPRLAPGSYDVLLNGIIASPVPSGKTSNATRTAEMLTDALPWKNQYPSPSRALVRQPEEYIAILLLMKCSCQIRQRAGRPRPFDRMAFFPDHRHKEDHGYLTYEVMPCSSVVSLVGLSTPIPLLQTSPSRALARLVSRVRVSQIFGSTIGGILRSLRRSPCRCSLARWVSAAK